jgi:hypothetical protein
MVRYSSSSGVWPVEVENDPGEHWEHCASDDRVAPAQCNGMGIKKCKRIKLPAPALSLEIEV